MASRRISDDAKPVPKPPATAPKKSGKSTAGDAASAPAVAAAPAATPVVPVAKPRKPRAPSAPQSAATNRVKVSADERRGMIARAAYLRGQSRGFPPGGEAEDWMVAEKEIDALLSGGSGPAQ